MFAIYADGDLVPLFEGKRRVLRKFCGYVDVVAVVVFAGEFCTSVDEFAFCFGDHATRVLAFGFILFFSLRIVDINRKNDLIC